MVALLAVLAMMAEPGRASQGSVLVVTTTEGTNDGTCDASHCSLREAIAVANSSPGTDTIAFAIPGDGPNTIRPTSALPTITDPVIIDGYTQTGASPNTNGPGLGSNAVLKIELDGSIAGEGVNGLSITAGASTVRGLAINRFDGSGIHLETNGGNVIQGNFLGTDGTGTLDRGNGVDGVLISSGSNNTVGGMTPQARNVVSGNDTNGVRIDGPGTTGNLILGNFVGTDATGTAAVPNTRDGVRIDESSNNVVGGTEPGAGNLISGNRACGLWLTGTGTTESLVQGNFIGTDVTGTLALGNAADGLLIDEASNNVIGGTVPGARNVISGNNRHGLHLAGGATGNLVQGNLIGIDATGTAALGNGSHGVRILSGFDNMIGGLGSSEGNTIAFNGGAGVFALGGTGNAIQSNSIFSNTGLGIDLGSDGVTHNDAGDGDPGANNLQNFPVLTPASSGVAAIPGTLDSTPNTEFRLEFFSNVACDPSGHGEGASFLGSTVVTTGNDGTANFSFTVQTLPVGEQFITATATGPDGSTSEFSECLFVHRPGDANGDGVVNTADLIFVRDNWGVLGDASADLNGDGIVDIWDLTLVGRNLGK